MKEIEERKDKELKVEIPLSKIDAYEKEIYDYKQLLQISISLSNEILDISKLIESILYTCMAQMRVLGAGMFITKNFDSKCFSLDKNYNGLEIDKNITYKIPIKSNFVNFLCESNRTFTVEEFKELLDAKDIPKQILSLNPSLIIPLKLKNRLNGILILGQRIIFDETLSYSIYERNQIQAIASLSAIAINNTLLIEKSTTDIMTRLKLRDYFYRKLSNFIEEGSEFDFPLGVLMFDIDFFKKFNDTYGHACGDFVLENVAKIISDNVKRKGLAARYGGEEFVALLKTTNKEDSLKIAEKIRKKIDKTVFNYKGTPLHVTISIGVSLFNYGDKISANELVENADKALYLSKSNGRNCVSFFYNKNNSNEN